MVTSMENTIRISLPRENEIKGEYYHGMRIGEWIFSNSQQNVVENITYSDGKKWQGTYTIWDGTKRKIDCSGDLVIPVLSYENGVLSHLYRDNNFELKTVIKDMIIIVIFFEKFQIEKKI